MISISRISQTTPKAPPAPAKRQTSEKRVVVDAGDKKLSKPIINPGFYVIAASDGNIKTISRTDWEAIYDEYAGKNNFLEDMPAFERWEKNEEKGTEILVEKRDGFSELEKLKQRYDIIYDLRKAGVAVEDLYSREGNNGSKQTEDEIIEEFLKRNSDEIMYLSKAEWLEFFDKMNTKKAKTPQTLTWREAKHLFAKPTQFYTKPQMQKIYIERQSVAPTPMDSSNSADLPPRSAELVPVPPKEQSSNSQPENENNPRIFDTPPPLKDNDEPYIDDVHSLGWSQKRFEEAVKNDKSELPAGFIKMDRNSNRIVDQGEWALAKQTADMDFDGKLNADEFRFLCDYYEFDDEVRKKYIKGLTARQYYELFKNHANIVDLDEEESAIFGDRTDKPIIFPSEETFAYGILGLEGSFDKRLLEAHMITPLFKMKQKAAKN